MKREDAQNVIREAYKESLLNTHLRFTVWQDAQTGDFYTSTGTAGGNNIPIKAWEDGDEAIAIFDYQYWCPEDGDELYRENLISYLSDDQVAQVKMREEEDEEELSGGEIGKMFPDAYQEYKDFIIGEIVDALDPDEYLTDAKLDPEE